MLFNTVKLLSPTGDGGGQDQTPTGQEDDNKQPTLEEVVKGFSTVNETVSKITQTLENVMKAVEELKAPKKVDNPQPTDNKIVGQSLLSENVVTKDYLENFQKTLIESVTKASQTVLTQDKETRMIDDLVPYEHNPRKLKEDQAKQLTKSLEKFNLLNQKSPFGGFFVAGYCLCHIENLN